jgi:2-dehydropantoate 2-reductase
MRIGILGVGGIGGVIGGYLARAARDVTLIDLWPENIEYIKANGITVTAQDEEFTARARALHLGEVAAARPAFDVVVLSVKSYDTSWSAKFIQPYLRPGGFIASAQNSINEDAIAEVVGWPRVVGCVVTLGAAMYEPGRPQRTSPSDRPAFTLGEPSGMITPRIERLAGILSDVGPTKTTGNLWGERWAKLATNCMSNAVAGMTGLKSAELREDPAIRRLSIAIAGELMEVASALGVSVEPISGIPAAMFLDALTDGSVQEEVEQGIVEAGRNIGTGRPSLAQDVMKGRKTEVEELNGYVVKKGLQVGVPTPVNRAIVALTKRVEAGDLEPSLSNLEHIEY